MRRVFNGATRARLPTTPCYYSPRLNAFKSTLVKPKPRDISTTPASRDPRPSLINRDRTVGRIKSVAAADYESDRAQHLQKADSSPDSDPAGPPVADEPLEDAFLAPSPGDYMLISGGQTFDDGIFLKLSDRGMGKFLLDSGEEVEVALAVIGITIRNVFDKKLAEAASIPLNEDQSIPQRRKDASVQLIRSMRRFRRQRDIAAYTVRQAVSERLYPAFRSSDPDAWQSLSLDDATAYARKLLGSKAEEFDPDMIKVGTYQFLIEEAEYFNPDPFSTVLFHAAPASSIQRLRQVRNWVRLNDPRIGNFVTKAKIIIDDLKASPATSGGEISWRPLTEHAFSEDELTMIQVLNDSLRRTVRTQENPYESILATVSRGLEDTELEFDGTRSFAFALLAKMGVHPPWGNLLATDDSCTPWTAQDDAIAAAEAERLAANLKAIEASGSSVPVFGDGVDDVRHDWGDMPAYVIDNESAEELDDGISVVPAQDGSNATWVHVHIADPTALLRPDDPLAKIAQKRVGTLYFMEKTFPLLPPGFASLFSLGRGGAQPVFTFSAKISNEDGKIVESSMKPGIIRKVHTITYDEMDRALGSTPSSEGYLLSELSNRPPTPAAAAPRELSESFVKDIKAIAKTAEILSRRRGIMGAYNFLYPTRGEVEVDPKPLPMAPFPPPAPMKYEGGPTYFLYKGLSSCFEANNAKWAVAEMMMMGCRVAARYAQDHQVPILYRHNHSPNVDELCGKLRDPLTGAVEYGDEARQVATFGGVSTTPGGNTMLGLEGDPYARVTSPLRRFGDLVNHWQLKSHLSTSAPKISREALESLATVLTSGEAVGRKVQRTNRRFWISSAIRRLFIENPNVLKGLEAYIGTEPKPDLSDGQRNFKVVLHVPSLGSEGLSFGPLKDFEDLPVGVKVLVDVVDVAMSTGGFYACKIVGRL